MLMKKSDLELRIKALELELRNVKSNNAFVGDREKAIEPGCNDYITKPVNKTLLYELIKKHCYK